MKKHKLFCLHSSLLLTAFLCGSLLVGCSQKPKDADVPPLTVIPTVTMIPSISPTPTLTPEITETIKHSISPSPGAENNGILTSEDAKALILERIDITKYTVDLIDSSLTLNETVYYSFLVSEGNFVYEPALIVDQKTGEIFCYDASGTISDYTNFPLYKDVSDETFDWNGSFYEYDSAGVKVGTLTLGQGDTNSLEFDLSIKSGFEEEKLSGIATIHGNSASFTGSDGLSLHFIISDGVLAITESRSGSTVTKFAGIYYSDTANKPKVQKITPKEAESLLSTLTKKETGLPDKITRYTLTDFNQTIEIKGTVCYSIGVYADLEDRMLLMNTYYVAVDGSKIFVFDYTVGDDVELWSRDK